MSWPLSASSATPSADPKTELPIVPSHVDSEDWQCQLALDEISDLEEGVQRLLEVCSATHWDAMLLVVLEPRLRTKVPSVGTGTDHKARAPKRQTRTIRVRRGASLKPVAMEQLPGERWKASQLQDTNRHRERERDKEKERRRRTHGET